MVVHPPEVPLLKAKNANMPGKNTSRVLPVVKPGPPVSFWSKGAKSARYNNGVATPIPNHALLRSD
jgi:hypothetical protein